MPRLTEQEQQDIIRYVEAVKVVDIFGNDTMTIVEVTVPNNGKNGGKK